MTHKLLDGIIKALATLEAHEVTPGSLEVTRAVFERLKAECCYTCTTDEPNHIFGIKIIVKD